jgi:hypothetical protein
MGWNRHLPEENLDGKNTETKNNLPSHTAAAAQVYRHTQASLFFSIVGLDQHQTNLVGLKQK